PGDTGDDCAFHMVDLASECAESWHTPRTWPKLAQCVARGRRGKAPAGFIISLSTGNPRRAVDKVRAARV
ncbi:MAG: hypothetical protein KGL63_06125, partial [Betaproteobacteria bacterium]|nr:hypothetical protein [Betaproteobacteria bacterium]